jgi:hypothetical protein
MIETALASDIGGSPRLFAAAARWGAAGDFEIAGAGSGVEIAGRVEDNPRARMGQTRP